MLSRAARHVREIRAVGHEAAGIRKRPERLDRRQSMSERELRDAAAMRTDQHIGMPDEGVGMLATRRFERRVEVAGGPNRHADGLKMGNR